MTIRDALRASEQKVADFILQDPTRAVDLNMGGLANAAEVSEPTVMRFCSAAGFDGFSSFKMALVRALALGQHSTVTSIHPDEDVTDLIGKMFNYTISGLDRVRNRLDGKSIDQAIELLLQANEIIFIGAGSSGIVAQDAQQKFPLFGRQCHAPIDFHQQFMVGSMCNERSVIVAISNTGKSRTVIEVAKQAKLSGGKIISITGGSDNPLAKLADVQITAVTFEDTELYTPTVSRIADLVIIDILATGVALRSERGSLERILEFKEKMIQMRG
jgi:RpiR family carbohydrate utilization transcriptional regulator